MEIKTKYNIGDKILVMYRNNNEVSMYEDTIKEITVMKEEECTPLGNMMKTKILYYGDICPDEIEEKDVVLLDDDYAVLKTLRNKLEKLY